MRPKHTYNFKAKITLYSSAMGGRIRPVYSGYRPSFIFNSKKHYSGEIHLIDKDILMPGESSEATIRLLPASTIRGNLKPNDAFTISEGNKTVGSGVIEKVVLHKV